MEVVLYSTVNVWYAVSRAMPVFTCCEVVPLDTYTTQVCVAPFALNNVQYAEDGSAALYGSSSWLSPMPNHAIHVASSVSASLTFICSVSSEPNDEEYTAVWDPAAEPTKQSSASTL